MSSWIEDLDPRIKELAVEAAKKVAAFLWHRIAGEDTERDKEALAAIERRVIAGILESARNAAALQASIAGIDVTIDQMAFDAADIVRAFEAIRNPTIPRLGFALEEVSPEEWDRTHPKEPT